jgi:hypothetical protein
MMFRSRLRLAALLLTALGLPVLPGAAAVGQGRWSPDAPSNRQVVATFNYATVESVLDEIGARHERRGPAERPSLLVTFPSGRRAAIVFGSCSDGGNVCRAISLQSGWTLPRGATSARAAELTQAFARRYAFSRAFVMANGNLALQRYLTADYGFIRGNLAVNLLAFAAQLDLFAREVLAPLSRR